MSADNQQGRTLEYRVMCHRFDELEREYDAFQAKNDDEAKRRFEKYKKDPSLGWDYLRLIRVDQQEETTIISED